MGIQRLGSVAELYDVIEQDKYSDSVAARRFPIRFTFLNSFDELRDTIAFLVKNWDVELKELTELLSDKNGWLTADDILKWIKEMANNAVVVPLSEFLRFQRTEGFYKVLKSLTEIENPNNLRIYIPLIGLWERFELEFWTSFYRKEEWAPVWRLETAPQKMTIYQIGFGLRHISIALQSLAVISTTEEWLSVWKRENVRAILSQCRPLSQFCKDFLPDQAFELRNVSNQQELLKKIFEFETAIEYKDHESEFWEKLVEEVVRYNERGLTLKDIFLRHFNLRNLERLTPGEFLALYLRASEHYERWLIKNVFLGIGRFQPSYLRKCLERLAGLEEEELIEKLWFVIFQLPSEELTDKIFTERKVLLTLVHKNLSRSTGFIEGRLDHELKNIKGEPLKRKFQYLTSITRVERKYLLSELKDVDIRKILPNLVAVYPELAFYLDWDLIKPDNEVDNWILEYFWEYNCSKVKHTKSPKIKNLIDAKNKNKSTFSDWYYSLPKPEMGEDVKYVWIDGLGGEWFPLIVHLLDKYGKAKGRLVRKKMLTRVILPSTTECNRYDCQKIEILDDHIHKQETYRYPDDLVEEIELIEQIVKQIMEMSDPRICIVSDHGYSFLCLKDFGNFKRLDLPNAEHEGRCMWIEGSNWKDDEYFMVWSVDEGRCQGRNVLVALKHVSLNNTPRREVHGGATPEEVLVPYIAIEVDEKKVEYQIEVIDPEVWVANPVVRFKVRPQASYIPEAFVKGRSLKVSWDKDEDVYKIDIKGLPAGTHTITLKIGKVEYQKEITIRAGFRERDLL